MSFTLSYSMITGGALREAQSAADAVAQHEYLMNAGAAEVTIRDGHGTIISLREVRDLARAEAVQTAKSRRLSNFLNRVLRRG